MNKENRKKQSCGDAKLMWSIVFGLTRLCPGGGHGHGRAAVNLRRTERKKGKNDQQNKCKCRSEHKTLTIMIKTFNEHQHFKKACFLRCYIQMGMI